MPSLRHLRRKIRSVRSTQQITKAMKMVAAARMRRAQASILAARPFAGRMEEAVRDLALLEVASDVAAGREIQIHEFFDLRPGRPCLVVVAGDKGLCGAFNTNIIRGSIEWLKANNPVDGRNIAMAVVGRKARDVMRRLKEIDIVCELVGIFPKATYAQADILGKAVLEAYCKGGVATVDVLYNEFASVSSQRVREVRLLPIPTPDVSETPGANVHGFKFEPRREELLDHLLPRYIKARLFRVLLESQAAELAARMNAMDSASKNAGDLIESLTLKLNRARQAMITREIADLVGGVEALAA